MIEPEAKIIVGRVLRASTQGFDCGAHSTNIGPQHDFGALVKVPVANMDGMWAFGLIFSVEIESDELVTELVMAEGVNINVLNDHRENRMIPVAIRVLNVGFSDRGQIIHSLPPRPPMSLSGRGTVYTRRNSGVQQYLRLFPAGVERWRSAFGRSAGGLAAPCHVDVQHR